MTCIILPNLHCTKCTTWESGTYPYQKHNTYSNMQKNLQPKVVYALLWMNIENSVQIYELLHKWIKTELLLTLLLAPYWFTHWIPWILI